MSDVHKVLVVDDSALILSIIKDALETVPSVSVTATDNARHAVELVKNGDYALVLLDVEMPGMTGLEALDELRQRGFDTSKVVIFSGDDSPELSEELDRRQVEFLHKPVEPQALFLLLKRRWGLNPSAPRNLPGQPFPATDETLQHFNGNAELFEKSLGRFLDEYRRWLDVRQLGPEFPELKDYRFFLHTLKGISSYLGATGIVQKVGLLQDSIRKGTPRANLFLRESGVLLALQRFLRELEHHFSETPPRGPAAPVSVTRDPRPVSRPTILVVDDVTLNVDILRETLQTIYRVVSASNGEEALAVAHHERPDLILLDVVMPGMNGFETCRQLKREPLTKDIPVIFISTKDSPVDEDEGFLAGGVDYIHKPANPQVVRARVRTHLLLSSQNRNLEALVRERTQDLLDIQHQIVKRLSAASEFKDHDTGEHITRIGRYTVVLARSLGIPEDQLNNYRDAAILHDVGKIGIPDAILNKTDKLTPREWEIMKSHTVIGARLLQDLPHELFQLSTASALTHHERWDGSGYPHGLAGLQIPLIGRIVAILDVFDALISNRPYKLAWSREEALKYIEQQNGTHFDPEIEKHFFDRIDEILKISQHR